MSESSEKYSKSFLFYYSTLKMFTGIQPIKMSVFKIPFTFMNFDTLNFFYFYNALIPSK